MKVNYIVVSVHKAQPYRKKEKRKGKTQKADNERHTKEKKNQMTLLE